MSTPQTLSMHPYHQLDHHRQRLLEDRFLPPPRPSSNMSLGNIIHNPLAARTQSRASNHSHSQSRTGAEQHSYPNSLAQQRAYEDLNRTSSAASQHPRPPPHPSSSHAPPEVSMPPKQATGSAQGDSVERGRKRGRKSPVDWVDYFGGKPPAEIITIHDDDSPAPPAEVQRLPPPTNGTSATHHVDKKRRTNGGSGDANYSSTNTPYSHSNGASTESLQATTANTSLGSQVSTGSKLDGPQTGQKRKRTGKAAEPERKKQEIERAGRRGYLAEYGEYIPPPKQGRKQKEVHVPTIHDVRPTTKSQLLTKRANNVAVQRHKTTDKVDDEDGHYVVHENSRLGERYNLVQLLGQGTFGKVVKALDIRTRKEVAVKIIRAVPKVRTLLVLRWL